jgi:hypothetical protein
VTIPVKSTAPLFVIVIRRVPGPETAVPRSLMTNSPVFTPEALVPTTKVLTSSLAFKTNVRTYANALDTVNRLRGVRFDWKETGNPGSGGRVAWGKWRAATGVNYSGLVGVLVEAVKEQQVALNETGFCHV